MQTNGHLVIKESPAMALAHWLTPNGEKISLGVLSIELYRDRDSRAAFVRAMSRQAARMLAKRKIETRAAP